MPHSRTTSPDGKPVQIVHLEHPSGHRLSVMDWGATWLSCTVPAYAGDRREVLLGCGSLEDWFTQEAYFGATVGRYANRIGAARFSRDGREYRLLPNQDGRHQLHGGPQGFSHRRWQILDQSETHVLLGIESADGDQGFPGQLNARVSYRLEDDLRIAMEYWAEVDQACPVNLTNHAYFNLDGDAPRMETVLDHELSILSATYVPVDAALIPLGQLESVVGTSFDFREAKRIGADLLTDEQQKRAGGYDHAWLLDAACHDMRAPAARLMSSDGSLSMEVFTTMPALQFYSGNVLAGTPNRHGAAYGIHQGLALETEFLPDSPNHPEWPQPSCWLEPGGLYHHRTDVLFRTRPAR